MLHVHHASRADRLVVALADVLGAPPEDPFAREVVAVHSQGQERWLAQQLAGRLGATDDGDGVCAGVDFPFPGRLVGDAVATACGVEPDTDPWRAERLVWPLFEVVEDALAAGDPRGVLGPLRGHLRDDAALSPRRFAAVRRVADLFDRYAVHRPRLVRGWAEAEDGRFLDARGEPLPAPVAWQARLWCEVRRAIGRPSPPERLADAVAELRTGRIPLDLPARVSLFGLTALPASYLEVLAALAVHRDVHLFLLHPSPGLWRRVADLLAALPPGAHPTGAGATSADTSGTQTTALRSATPPSRELDPTRQAAANPLLRAWGRDAREMQVVVGMAGDVELHPLDVRPSAEASGPLLSRLQADVRGDAVPPGPPLPGAHDRRPQLSPDDRSVQVHGCHGPARQVEVLRDALLHLFADDATLEPRDVVVMCPDIETFAPLIEAVFGARVVATQADTPSDEAAADGLPPDLRVQLADRSLRRTNPVLRVVAELLALSEGRVTASEVLDLAAREPVRRRFRLDEDELAILEGWADDLRIRWGLDLPHRTRIGVETDVNTWRRGLDRLLVGAAVADEDLRTVGGVAPFDDVEGSDVDLAGRFAELLDRLQHAVEVFAEPKPLAAWCEAIDTAADALTDVADADAWQRAQLGRVLDRLREDAGIRSDGLPLTVAELRTLLDDRLRGGPSRASHRTGDLTVCTLVPMRSVPHRVVCLLGMDDETFPRRTVEDGDDLLARDPRVGDRDARTEDRQLLLDALLAAGEHLVVTYTARDERTNEPKPPAVPIGELLDTIDRTVRIPGGIDGERRARQQVLTIHPLQPFDPRIFTPGALGRPGPFGFDPADLAGARALAATTSPAPPFLEPPLDPPDEPVVALGDLIRFLEHPAAALLQQRLQVRYPRDGERVDDAIPVELSPLASYAVGDRLLDAVIAGAPRERWLAMERARDTLPPGALAEDTIDAVGSTVDLLLETAADHGVSMGPADEVELEVPLADGRVVRGVVGEVVDGTIRSVRYSRLKPKPRLAAWVRLLALTAAHPETAWRAVTVQRCRQGVRKDVSVSVLGPLGSDADQRAATASRLLHQLVDLRARGLSGPVPLLCDTSAAYAEAVWANRTEGRRMRPRNRAANTWEGDLYPEGAQPAHQAVLGADVPFDRLFSAPPAEDEKGEGWDELESTRFGRWALTVWAPLLAHEMLEDR